MKANTFDVIKKILRIVIFLSIVIIFILLLIASSDSKRIKNIKSFIKDGTKVLYITNNMEYSEYPIELFDKYEIDYMYISSNDINSFEKSKLEDIINSKHLSNSIVVFKNGELIDTILDYEAENSLNVFLQNLNIIPDVIGNIEGIVASTTDMLNSEFAILYFPYRYINGIETQDDILNNIAMEYNIEYKMINAYLLSISQQEKLNSILQISSVEDQIVILVKNGKIVGSIRGIKSEKEYLNELYETNFIAEIENQIKFISYDKFKEIINETNKNIVVIIKDNCKYCDDVVNNLTSISEDYNVDINYLNIEEIGGDISNSVEKILLDMGYSDGFTTPITILTESGNLIDYIIGSSTEKYFVDIFTENGIIK